MSTYKRYCYKVVTIALKNEQKIFTKFQLINMYRGLYEDHYLVHMVKQEILIKVGTKYKLGTAKVLTSVLMEEMLRIQKEKLEEMKVIKEELVLLKEYQKGQRLEVLK